MDCALGGGGERHLGSFQLAGTAILDDLEAAGVLTIRPSMIPKLSLMTLARGARQFVVQEALLQRQRCTFIFLI